MKEKEMEKTERIGQNEDFYFGVDLDFDVYGFLWYCGGNVD